MTEFRHNNEGSSEPNLRSGVRRMINEIENRNVRMVNNDTGVRLHHAPIQGGARIKQIKEQLFGFTESRVYLSAPSLLMSNVPTKGNISNWSCGKNLDVPYLGDPACIPDVPLKYYYYYCLDVRNIIFMCV